MVAMDGHEGPKEIKVQPEFFAWLTDPVKNGAGALFDFGCYGANLMTWLMDNQRPIKVTAIAQTDKPQIYARWTTRRPFWWSTRKRRGSSRRRGTGRSAARISRFTAKKRMPIATGGNKLRVRMPGQKRGRNAHAGRTAA